LDEKMWNGDEERDFTVGTSKIISCVSQAKSESVCKIILPP